MEIGEWYRVETVNPDNGKREWKYYRVDEIYNDGTIGIEVYKIYWNGRISGRRKSQSSATALEQCARVPEEVAKEELNLKDT